MRFPAPLVPARLLRRYKRFLADVRLDDGRTMTVNCPNPGAMTGLKDEGARIWLSPTRNPRAKLPYVWELVETPTGLVGVNTQWPNHLVVEAIGNGRIAELQGYTSLRREVPYGHNSRIDLLLEGADRPAAYVEIKNVHLRRHGPAEFPDTITARGAKHMEELARVARGGLRAVVVYVVQREDCASFCLARDIDPAYAKAADAARRAGVEALCYAASLSTEKIEIVRPLPIQG